MLGAAAAGGYRDPGVAPGQERAGVNWCIRGKRAGEGSARQPVSEQRVLTPRLVGRDDVIAALQQLARGVASGDGSVALISGEAGIGKTRVLGNLRRELEAEGWRAVRAACYEEDRNTPFSAVADLLRALHMLDEPGWMEGLKPETGLISRVFPRLGADLEPQPEPPDQEPAQLRARLADALHGVLSACVKRGPLLVAIEDIHWADEGSLEVLLRLARRVEGLPVLLAFTLRDEDAGPAVDHLVSELARERRVEEVALEPLTLGQTDSMVRTILGHELPLRSDFLHALYQLTDGNPFFIEEVVGPLLSERGEGIGSTSIAELRIPRSVREAVVRRVLPLPEPARHLLNVAAVAGVQFDVELLQRVTGLDDAAMLESIRALTGARLVVDEGAGVLGFRHALTREAVRGEMLSLERRSLSRRLAEALQSARGGDLQERVEDLGALFLEAEDWANAFRYASEAGRRALNMYSPVTALGQFSRALEAASHLAADQRAQEAEVVRLRGTAQEAIGDFERARTDYENAVARAGAAGDGETRWRALLNLGLLWASRDYTRCEPYFRMGLEQARAIGDSGAIGHSLNRLANWHSNIGEYERAAELSEEALATFRAAGNQEGAAETLDLLGMTFTQAMQLPRAANCYRQAISLLEELDDRRTLASALASIQIGSGTYQTDMAVPALPLTEGSAFGSRGLLLARECGSKAAEAYALWQLAFSLGPQGAYGQALTFGEEALAIAQQIGHTQWELAAHCALGGVYTDLLYHEAATAHLEQAVALAQKMGAAFWSWQASALLIDALVCSGQPEAGLRLFEEAVERGPEPLGGRHLYVAKGDALLALERSEEALEIAELLMRLTRASGRAETALRVARLAGRVRVAAGDLEGALELLSEAEAAAGQQGHLSLAWRLNADMAHAWLAAGDRDAARAAADKGLRLVEGLAERIPDEPLSLQFRERAFARLPGGLRRRQAGDSVGRLTRREAEIAVLVARGLTNREIAEELVLSTRTVETHIANALAKMGFATRAQLAGWAVEQVFRG